MTLNNQPTSEIKNGNDSTTSFSFDFKINQASDLQVVHTSGGVDTVLTEGSGSSNYSLTVSSYPGSGSITYPATLGTELATGDTLTLARSVTLNQETDLINQGAWNPGQVEDALDYGLMIDQQQQNEIDRSIKVPISDDSGANFSLPAPTANTVLGVWNSDGTAIIAGPTSDQISNAQSSATAAAASAVSAASYRDTAETHKDAAAVSAAEAAASAAAADAADNLKGAQNLSDVDDAATARTNLGVQVDLGADAPTAPDANKIMKVNSSGDGIDYTNDDPEKASHLYFIGRGY